MFREFFRFELKYHFSRLSTYIYFTIFFLLGFLAMNAAGGAFEGFVVGSDNIKVMANAPVKLHIVIALFSYLGIIIVSAIAGTAVYRDYEYNTHSLFYTAPITKRGYLLGRFLGSLTVLAGIFSSIGLGLMAGSAMPWLESSRFGSFDLVAYLLPYAVSVLPNLLFTGSIFFALATLTRNILSTYLASVIFLIGYLSGLNLLSDIDNKALAAMVDPLGLIAVELDTQYWTVAEQNSRLITLTGKLLYNRMLWSGLGLAIFGFVYTRFSFSVFSNAEPRKKRQAAEVEAGDTAEFVLPFVTKEFSAMASLKQMLRTARNEFRAIVRDAYFITIVLAGVLFIFVSASQINSHYGTTTYPVTYSVLEIAGGSFGLFLLIIITFYAGQLVWKERELRMNQIYDALPVPTWVSFTGKFLALVLVQCVLLGVVGLCGIIIQASNGYFNFELPLYAKDLFGLHLPDLALLCALAMFVQVVVNNKYAGHFIMVLYYLLTIFYGKIGIEHNLLKYSGDPGYIYSDMNGYGHFLGPYFAFKIYWGAFAVLLALASRLLWVRSTEDNWKMRRKLVLSGMGTAMKSGFLGVSLLFLGSGGFIFYNTNILNDFETSKESEKLLVDFERKYKKFEGAAQPRLRAVRVEVDLYPEERKAVTKGHYILKNLTGRAIDSIHVNIDATIEIRSMRFDRASGMALSDKKFGYYIYRLAEPLQPSDSIAMSFEIVTAPKGFTNDLGNSGLVDNGTFINSAYMPAIGYNPDAELSGDETRRKYGLKPKERMAPVNDMKARENTYISGYADWIDFEATLSTSPDQIAIAPGYLQKEWMSGGRRYFHYKMDAPILNFYSFLSARYEVRKDRWNDVAIEIYYHKGHEYNIGRMISAVKKSLDYYTRNFSPYQHRQVRIIEFPRYASFAQSFPNTIPYSESIGFIAKVDPDKEDDIDYPFYITAHEIAHQWWAHQVIGGNVQGATLLSETMAQYSALMVMEKEYGREKIEKFLRYELDRYLSGRSSEDRKELPLALVENQQYIHYNKGSVVLYSLRDYIGEERLNRALSSYIKAVGFQRPPFTNSTEFLSYIRAETPDSLQYLIGDLFENITLFENKAVKASYTKLQNGKYAVDLLVESQKLRADSLGNEKAMPLGEWIDIGVFGEDKAGKGQTLYLSKHRIDKPSSNIRLVVEAKPVRAGIDPYHKLIDRHPEDNTRTME